MLLAALAFLWSCNRESSEPENSEQTPKTPPKPARDETKSLYFATQQASEYLLQQIKALGLLESGKLYSIQLGAGLYQARGSELLSLQERMTRLDAHDGSVDGVMSDFYQQKEEVWLFFASRRWKYPVFLFHYEDFQPSDPERYGATKQAIAQVFQERKVYWDAARATQPITDYQELDIRSLTEAALSTNYSADVLQTIDQELSGRAPYRLTYQMQGMGSGIRSGTNLQGISEIMFAIGASTLFDIKNASNDSEASQAMRGWIRHEFFHSYVNLFSYGEVLGGKPNGMDVYVQAIAKLTKQEDLKERIKSKLGEKDLYYFEYYTQEVCDPVIISKLSLGNWARRVREYEKILDDDLKKEGPDSSAESKEVVVLKSAWNIQSLRAAGVDAKKINLLEQQRRQWIETNVPGGLNLYEDSLKWFALAQSVAQSDRFKTYVMKTDPGFFDPF